MQGPNRPVVAVEPWRSGAIPVGLFAMYSSGRVIKENGDGRRNVRPAAVANMRYMLIEADCCSAMGAVKSDTLLLG